MIKIWKGDPIVVILIDLYKAFDTINHGLPLAKIETHSFSTNSLDESFSDWIEILARVP